MHAPTTPVDRPRPGAARKPRGLRWLVFRAPVWIYRLRLGWLLGHRFLLLTHRGRKTGVPHQAMLEVIAYDPATQISVVFSGRGTRADWYRNILAAPALEVRTGRQRYAPEHRVLTPAEVARVSARFTREHPIEARLFAPVLKRLGWLPRDAPADAGLPPGTVLVAFRPRAAADQAAPAP